MIILDDFEIRYKNILSDNPNTPRCSFAGCENPIDGGTTCAYHRLLFDHWMYEVKGCDIMNMSQRGRRIAFSRWAHKTGKETCDAIVLDMAQYEINWIC
jgi:hypothetical protein